MRRSFLLAPAFVAGLALAATLLSSPAISQDRDDYAGGSLDAHRHGYEHGYRDGYELGVKDQQQGLPLNIRTDAFHVATRGYRPEFGPEDAFREGYRQGYRQGAEDGYASVQSGLQQTFGWRGNFNADQGGNADDSRIYRQHNWNYQDVATDIGYRDGVNAGMRDFNNGRRFDPDSHEAWRNANHGWDQEFADRQAYRDAYRAAFEAGYRDGYSRNK